eukprot:TRINITY_DN19619_c0_g1_i1.p2 TRINITY_DN19619_c0_g1~~TRINITY_DN19619_c0_g1_i1.p2  ORF type:complete len:186 (+),score=9.45 TRINITY_DN19619_c0_g1_i1:94-651(+)
MEDLCSARENCIFCKDTLCFLRRSETNLTAGPDRFNFYDCTTIGPYTLQIWRVTPSSSFSQKYLNNNYAFYNNSPRRLPPDPRGPLASVSTPGLRSGSPMLVHPPMTWQLNIYKDGQVLDVPSLSHHLGTSWGGAVVEGVRCYTRTELCGIIADLLRRFEPDSGRCPILDRLDEKGPRILVQSER